MLADSPPAMRMDASTRRPALQRDGAVAGINAVTWRIGRVPAAGALIPAAEA